MARQISGFSLLPVVYSPSVTHFLYLKAHSNGKKSTNTIPGGRTLFVVNVPPDASREEMLSLFRPHGAIERIIMDSFHIDETVGQESDDGDEPEVQVATTEITSRTRSRKRSKKGADHQTTLKKPIVVQLPTVPMRQIRSSGKSAYIVFVEESSVQRTLSSTQSTSIAHWPSSAAPRGHARYVALHDNFRPPLTVIREHADTSIELYDYDQAQKKAHLKSQYKKGEAIVDEDGFTLVTRGGAYGQSVGGGVAVASKKFEQTGIASESRRKKKNLPKEKEKFYAFQVHEKNREGMVLYSPQNSN
jgi:ribosomal RNA-processing protein 7